MAKGKRPTKKKSGLIGTIVACPSPIYTECLGRILQQDKLLQIVSEASNLIALVEACRNFDFDILLLDVEIKGLNLNKILEMVKKNRDAKIVLMVDNNYNENLLINGIRSGIRGYVSKNEKSDEIIESIHAVYEGELWAERKLMGKVVDGTSYPTTEVSLKGQVYDLTETEIKIIRLVLTGLTNKEVATELYISEKTVKFHLYKVFKKLAIKNRSELMLFGFRNGLIS